MDERLQRLKRWLHRTQLDRYDFNIVLRRKRQKELLSLAQGDGSDIKPGQLPAVRNMLKRCDSTSHSIHKEGASLLELSIGQYDLVLWYDHTLRTPHGWLCSCSCGPYELNPDLWLNFKGWPTEYLERLIEVLPDLISAWNAEDEYINKEFVKIEKIQVIRERVRILGEQRST